MLNVERFRFRHRIFALPAPRVTTRQSFQAEPASAQDAMALHCLEKIPRTGGMKPAAGPRSAQPHKQRRERPFVGTNQETNQRDHCQGRRIEARPSYRNRRIQAVQCENRLCAATSGHRDPSHIVKQFPRARSAGANLSRARRNPLLPPTAAQLGQARLLCATHADRA